jgi:hypothetical protein
LPSPAYWHYKDSQSVDHYMLYYSPTTDDAKTANPPPPPFPINAYSLLTSGSSGPIPYPATASTAVMFCERSPTPSGSWNSTLGDPATGILWAIEHQNSDNAPGAQNPTCPDSHSISHAALHAFSAIPNGGGVLSELYHSSQTAASKYIGSVATFSTPTIFNGHVYIGTQTGVDVFGLCASQQGGCLQ